MKLIRRLATVVMILSLLALPMASLAEGTRSFSIGNISLDAVGTSIKIGATVDVSMAQKDGSNLITLAVLGGESGKEEVGTVYFTSDEDGMKVALKGLSQAFAVTQEELKQAMAQYASQAGAVSQMDTEALTAMIENYKKLLDSQKDKEKANKASKELNEKLIAYLGDRYEEVGTESFEVFDKSYTGQRAKFTMNMADVDAIMDMMAESDPNAKAFLDSYFKFLSGTVASQGIEPFDSLSGLYNAVGMIFSFDIDLLSDETAGASKIDYVFHITVDGKTIDMPMQMQVLANDQGQEVCCVLDTVIEEVPMYMDIDVSETADGKSGFTMVMSAGPEDEKVDFNIDMTSLSADDKENCKFTFSAAMSGQQMATGEIAYDGTVTKLEPGRVREGKISVNASVAGYGDVAFAADVKYSNEPNAEPDFSVIDALPTVSISEMNDEKMQAITADAEVIAIKALGVLMQTPGVAEIVSTAMAAMQAPTDTSEYGYEDYSEDSEQLEDFENWEEIEGTDADVPA